ncbi:MAG: D-glycerate dehydrogenase [Kordiimonadaceae bacterium]|nr:D-glycerate dehydrogenase [Kordiimonadaceae bacterium]
MKPLVIVTRKLPASVELRMKELFNVRLNGDDKVFTKEDLIAAVKEAHVLVTTVTDEISGGVLSKAAPDLKMIANYGVGVDHIDLMSARDKRIIITNTPGVLTEDTADMAMLLILGITRRMSEGEKMLRAGKWKIWSPIGMLGMRLRDKNLGIIGMGRIGQALALRAKTFGLNIHYYNRQQINEDLEKSLCATYWASLDQMITQMNIISLNCSSTPDTHHIMSRRRIGLMQKNAYLINTTRGDVVDEDALIEALEEKTIAGAGLDVYKNEPNINPRVLNLDNVLLTPHMGSATDEARIAMGEKVIINVKTFLDGHSPGDRVLA